MPSLDRTVGIKAKIERAEEHVRNLESEIRVFFARNPYSLIAYDDAQSGDRIIQVRVREEIPIRLSIIVGDVAHNLRAALDYLAWQLVLANGKVPRIENTSFPIFKAPFAKVQDHESAIRGKIHGASDEAVRMIKDLKSYKGGNDAFWSLRELNNIDKHRLLVTVGVAMQNRITMDFTVPFRNLRPDLKPQYFTISSTAKNSLLYDGAIIWRTPRDARAHLDMNPKFTFEISFGQGEVFDRDPVLPALLQLTDFVKRVVEPFNPLLIA